MSTTPRGGGGRPFQSKLEPHFDLIAQLRRDRKTWAEIAVELERRGTKCTPQGVCVFLKRRRRRRYALGMEPEGYAMTPAAATPPPTKVASSAPASVLTRFESLVDEAEITTRQQQKKKSVTVIRPRPGTPL